VVPWEGAREVAVGGVGRRGWGRLTPRETTRVHRKDRRWEHAIEKGTRLDRIGLAAEAVPYFDGRCARAAAANKPERTDSVQPENFFFGWTQCRQLSVVWSLGCCSHEC
jgi:hypothetical protein